MSAVKNIPLSELHAEWGAKMVPFAGWNMPVQYPGGILAEHRHTRSECSLFDISHMGEFRIAGNGAAAALDKALARTSSDLKIGACRYNLLLAEDGGIIDDLIVYRMEEEDFFLVVNAGNIAVDFETIVSRMPEGMDCTDLSNDLVKFDLQGPKAAEVLAKLGVDKAALPGYYRHTMLDIDGVRCIVSRTGYTGELGFELYFRADMAEDMWNTLCETVPVKPAGLGARDTLRLEMGFALYGHELDRNRSPFDCGLGALVDLSGDRDFTGKAALIDRAVTRQLKPVVLESRRAARAGAKVFDGSGKEIGTVTSGAFSPTLGYSIAICDITADADAPEGCVLQLETGSALTAGKVATTPFVKETSLRAKIV